MTETTIVSYDGTPTDADALALARVLAGAGAKLVLTYVRHTHHTRSDREQLEEHEAEALLERGAASLGDVGAERRVVVHGSTSEGLRAVAEQEDASLIVFGSEYRTPAGHVVPQRSTTSLLQGGRTAVAIAPASYAATEIRTIGLLAELDDHAAIDTAHALARHFEATVTDSAQRADLLIVGSRREAPEGRVMISAAAENAIDGATAPVLVVARGVPLAFRTPLYVS
jgi:nucleotide-binding universal stress UspA family protein